MSFDDMPPTEQALMIDWIRSRPPAVQALMRDWPLGASVLAVESESLICPRPGCLGLVVSYFEDGSLGIIHNNQADDYFGNMVAERRGIPPAAGPIKGTCDPRWLTFAEESPVLTRADVARILDAG